MKLENLKTAAAKNGPRLYIAGAGIGYIGTALLAIRATKKTMKKIEELKEELPEGETLSKKTIAKTCAKYYISTIATATASTILLASAAKSYEERTSAAITAALLNEAALKDLKEVVDEHLDKEKVEEVYKAVTDKQLDRAEAEHKLDVVHDAGGSPDGLQWFWEPIGKHPFRSTPSIVCDTIARLNMEASSDPMNGCITVEEYCAALGAEYPELGGNVFWDADSGYIDVGIEPHKRNGVNYQVLYHRNPPHFGNEKYLRF